MERDNIIIVGNGNGVSDIKKSWETRGIDVTLIKDAYEAKKRVGKTPYRLGGLEPDMFVSFIAPPTLLREIEKPLITMVLKETGGNQVQAAHILGLNRNTLRKKIKELNIPLDNLT